MLTDVVFQDLRNVCCYWAYDMGIYSERYGYKCILLTWHFQKWSACLLCYDSMCGVPSLQVLALDFHPHLVNHENPAHYSLFHSEIHNMTTMSNIYALPVKLRNKVCSASVSHI